MSQFPENNCMWQVYILRCNDDSYYTGCTSNMLDRLDRHNKGEIRYTSSRLPVDLIVTINFNNKYKAYDFERYLKSGSGRAFMSKRLV